MKTFQRTWRFLEDLALSTRKAGPAFGKVFDRKYMAAWHRFGRFPENAVRILLDVGAHDGHFSTVASEYFKLERVVLIEPLPSKQKHLLGLPIPGLTVIPVALSDYEGTAVFKINSTAEASSLKPINQAIGMDFGVPLSEMQSIEVKVRTLDSVANELRLSSIDFLKIDVQGAESDLLRGAARTIRTARYIQIEALFAKPYLDSADFAKIHSQLEEADFVLLDIFDLMHGPFGELLQCDALYENKHPIKRIFPAESDLTSRK